MRTFLALLVLLGAVLTGCGGDDAGAGAGATNPGTAEAGDSTAPPTSSPDKGKRPAKTRPAKTPPAKKPPTTATATPRSPIVIGVGGDTAFTHGLAEREPLGGVTSMLSAPDLTMLNLETVVAEPEVGTPLDKTYIFKSPPATVETLRNAGVDLVSLANNHTLDYGRDGLLRTIELLESGGVSTFGGGPTSDQAYAAEVVEVGDWTIGLVGFTHVECGWVADDPSRWPEAPWACPGFEERTVTAVEDAASGTDFTVVLVHWGIELQHCPESYQRDLATRWVDAGADLVVGSHPHLLQGVEQIDGVWVAHSTGNFAFPSAREDRAYSAFFTFEVSDEGVGLTAHPIYLTQGRPDPITGDSAQVVLETLATRSLGWTFTDDGNPVRRQEPGECGDRPTTGNPVRRSRSHIDRRRCDVVQTREAQPPRRPAPQCVHRRDTHRRRLPVRCATPGHARRRLGNTRRRRRRTRRHRDAHAV